MSPPAPRPELFALSLGDPPSAWRSLGFSADDDGLALGPVWVNLGAPGRGIVGWNVRGIVDEIDGLPVGLPPSEASGRPHPNGALGVDHVVVLTPDFDRTAAALQHAGLALRRIRQAREGVRQGFRRLGPAILEIVEAPQIGPGPARFWGLVVIVPDLDALAARLGQHLDGIKMAVQPGRRIATLREAAGLGEAIAFMDPEPASGER